MTPNELTLTKQVLRADTLRLSGTAEGYLVSLNILRSPKQPLTLQQVRQFHWSKTIDVPLKRQRTDCKPVRQSIDLFKI